MSWRGRGRGRGPPPPQASGNGADAEPEGPQPPFPDMIHIPEVPPVTPDDQILLQHWRTLTRAFKTSCYRLDPQAKKRRITDDPYALSKDTAGDAQKMPLTSVLTLDAKYFPEELFSSAEKRAAARASASRMADHKKPSGEADIFERFAALEKSGAKGDEGVGQGGRAGSNLPGREGQRGQDNEEGDEDLADDEEEEEEAFNDEMDLVMNENYDDDEGYMDDDDGGDGEGIY